MGCSCKQKEKIEKAFNANEESYEKKGIINTLRLTSISFINKMIMILLLIILTPIVIIVIIFNSIFKDKLSFIVPNFLIKYMKKKNYE